jgi:DNA processing protein
MAALSAPQPESAADAPDVRAAGLTGAERKVVEQLSNEPAHADAIIEGAGLPPAEVASVLMVLEIRRLVKRLPGQRYVKAAK